jgi:hypothetical protein
LVLFSVFESVVRERVLSQLSDELTVARSRQVKAVLRRASEGIANGSFFRILEVYKPDDAGLIEEVNQVRRYRNWVAHGRRSLRPALVDPRAAFDRLGRFLAILDDD